MKDSTDREHHRQQRHRIGIITKTTSHLVKQTMQTYSMATMKRAVGSKTKKIIEPQKEMVTIAE